jgi:hypothetical protein
VSTTARTPARLGDRSDMVRLLGLIQGHWAAVVIGTLARLGIVDQLDGGQGGSEELAGAVGVDLSIMARLLRAAAFLGCVRAKAQDCWDWRAFDRRPRSLAVLSDEIPNKEHPTMPDTNAHLPLTDLLGTWSAEVHFTAGLLASEIIHHESYLFADDGILVQLRARRGVGEMGAQGRRPELCVLRGACGRGREAQRGRARHRERDARAGQERIRGHRPRGRPRPRRRAHRGAATPPSTELAPAPAMTS